MSPADGNYETTCRCEQCCPENPGETYTRAYMLLCEARALLKMPLIERRMRLATLEKNRGKTAVDELKQVMTEEHQRQRKAA